MSDPIAITITSRRELDAFVAEKVMGWIDVRESTEAEGHMLKCWRTRMGKGPAGIWQPVPRYSTDSRAWLQVVRDLSRRYWLELKSPFVAGEKWFAGFTRHAETGWNGRPDYQFGHDEPGIAVSCAALMVFGFDVTLDFE